MTPCQEIGEDDIRGLMSTKLPECSHATELHYGSGPDPGANETEVNKTKSLPFWSLHSSKTDRK